MDIDEFLEAEGGEEKGGRKELETKQAAEFITDLSLEAQVAKIRELMAAKKYKDAEKIYFMVKEQYATLAKRQEEARRKIHRQLMEINKELLEHLDKARVELEQKTMIISDLLMKARQYMQQGNTDKANQLYLQVREIFKQIPDAFGERKMLLENQILTFYSQLVNEFNKRNYGRLLQKREEILRHIEIATNYVNLGNVEEAKKEYQLINKFYNELPEGFLYEKAVLYKRILALYQLTEEGVYKEARPVAHLAGMRQAEALPSAPMAPEGLPPVALPILTEKPESRVGTPAIETAKAEKKEEKRGIFGFLKKGGEAKTEAVMPVQEKAKRMMDAPPMPI